MNRIRSQRIIETVSLSVLFKEVTVNLGLVPFIDMYTDPDAINQLIIRMVMIIGK